MALVPFRNSGPAADQTARERLVQVGPKGLALVIRQHPHVGLRTLESNTPGGASWLAAVELETQRFSTEEAAPPGPERSLVPLERLGNVGLVVWQCGFVLAELMLSHPPLGQWHGVQVLDLGCGTGLVGIALACHGATVTLTDLPQEVLDLASENARLNCERHLVASHPRVVRHRWGDRATAQDLVSPRPDVITAADVLYDPRHYADLLDTLGLLSDAHTLVFIAWKKRHAEEEAFPALAEQRGWAVEQLPVSLLDEEFRDGSYVVLRLCRLGDPMDAS